MGEEGARFYRGSVINEFGRRREGCLCVGRSRWVGQPGTTRLHEKRIRIFVDTLLCHSGTVDHYAKLC
jgi:hypothetical protein